MPKEFCMSLERVDGDEEEEEVSSMAAAAVVEFSLLNAFNCSARMSKRNMRNSELSCC